MKYIVRKEGMSWTVRGDCGHFYAARRTHTDAITWADLLAYQPARNRTRDALLRIAIALGKMEARR